MSLDSLQETVRFFIPGLRRVVTGGRVARGRVVRGGVVRGRIAGGGVVRRGIAGGGVVGRWGVRWGVIRGRIVGGRVLEEVPLGPVLGVHEAGVPGLGVAALQLDVAQISRAVRSGAHVVRCKREGVHKHHQLNGRDQRGENQEESRLLVSKHPHQKTRTMKESAVTFIQDERE